MKFLFLSLLMHVTSAVQIEYLGTPTTAPDFIGTRVTVSNGTCSTPTTEKLINIRMEYGSTDPFPGFNNITQHIEYCDRECDQLGFCVGFSIFSSHPLPAGVQNAIFNECLYVTTLEKLDSETAITNSLSTENGHFYRELTPPGFNFSFFYSKDDFTSSVPLGSLDFATDGGLASKWGNAPNGNFVGQNLLCYIESSEMVTNSPTGSPTGSPTKSPLGPGQTHEPTGSPTTNSPTGSPTTNSPTVSPDDNDTSIVVYIAIAIAVLAVMYTLYLYFSTPWTLKIKPTSDF